MQVKLPVDVHMVVGDDRSMALLIGGFVVSGLSGDDIAQVLGAPKAKERKRRGSYKKHAAAAKKPVKRRSKSPAKKGTKANGTKSNKSQAWIDAIARANRRRNAERKAKGVCLRCDSDPVEGKALCQRHIDATRRTKVASIRKAA